MNVHDVPTSKMDIFVFHFCRRHPKSVAQSSWGWAASEQCLSVIMTQKDFIRF